MSFCANVKYNTINIKEQIPKIIIALGDSIMPSQQMISHGREENQHGNIKLNYITDQMNLTEMD